MTTFRQIRANQQNATLSTGPRSPGSEGNARTHGLSASKCISEEEKRLIETRLLELERELQPEGRLQHDEVAAVAAASVRLEMCQLEEESWRLHRAERAEFHWDADRQAEVMALVDKLPAKPQVIASRLRQTLRGSRWLLEEWRDLAWRVRGTGMPAAPAPAPLDETGRRRAFDLLGLSEERRQACTPLDLPGGGTGSEAEVAAHQDALIAGKIAELEALTDPEQVALDESIRIATVHSCGPGVDTQTRLIRRYETEARRARDRALENLAQLQETAARRKKEEKEREREAWMNIHLVPRRLPQDIIDEGRRQWEVKDQVEHQPQPQPQPQQPATSPGESQEDAPAHPAEAAPVSSVSAQLEAMVAREQARRLTLDPATGPLNRRARKAQAAVARAAHRTSR
jgi:hypothetical protein